MMQDFPAIFDYRRVRLGTYPSEADLNMLAMLNMIRYVLCPSSSLTLCTWTLSKSYKIQMEVSINGGTPKFIMENPSINGCGVPPFWETPQITQDNSQIKPVCEPCWENQVTCVVHSSHLQRHPRASRKPSSSDPGDEIATFWGTDHSNVTMFFGCWVSMNWGIKNGWCMLENPIKMDDLGVALFQETTI